MPSGGAIWLPAGSPEHLDLTPFRPVRCLAGGAMALWAAAAHAQSIEDARAALREGRFLEAAELGEAEGTSDGYALAAQSLAVYGHYAAPEEDRNAVLERAVELGEAAVGADPANAEAHLQAAHALGRRALSVGRLSALSEGLAGRIRDFLESALAIRPDFADAHTALGSWHADVADAGRIARWMFGGDREEAIIHFERALELAPDSKAVLLEYALRLPELDREGGRERAREMLTHAVELPAGDAYGELIHGDVVEALASLDDAG